MKVLVIDDDEKTAAAIKRGLEREGYAVDVAHDGLDGLWMAAESGAELIVLDVMLPGMNGYRVCRTLREREIWTPILMLTAKDGEWDEAEGLDIGADDYLVKPFSFPVLLARLRALARRTSDRRVPIGIGDLRIDVRSRRVWRDDAEVAMTARQFDVLEYLVRRAGQVVSKSDIIDGLWAHDYDGDPNIVEVYVKRLRRAIDEPFDRHSLETVRGAGYRIVDDRLHS
ncbi:MAG: response regulator transcription factor [Ilumatobacteraceae bacterium]